MTEVIIENGFERLFYENGLRSFDDFYNFTGRELANENSRRNVFGFSMGGTDFFLKRFLRPHLKDMFFAFKQWGFDCSQAKLERQNANYLMQHGINVCEPAAHGQKMFCGLERKSFIITKRLPGVCLTSFIEDNWRGFAQDEKRKFLLRLHCVVSKIRQLRISYPDLCLWHFFVEPKNGGYEFYMLDLHRMKIGSAAKRDFIRNYAVLCDSMKDEFFSQTDKRLVIFGDEENYDRQQWERISVRAAAIKNRRKSGRYWNAAGSFKAG